MIAKVRVAPDDIDGNGVHGHSDPDIYSDSDDPRRVAAMASTDVRSTLTPEILARRWSISLDKAKRTLRSLLRRV